MIQKNAIKSSKPDIIMSFILRSIYTCNGASTGTFRNFNKIHVHVKSANTEDSHK